MIGGNTHLPISDATYQTCAILLDEVSRKYRFPLDADHVTGKTSTAQEIDVVRIIKEAQLLSPQTLVDRLRADIEKEKRKYEAEKVRSDTADARLSEVRALIHQELDLIHRLSSDFVYLTIANTELTDQLKSAKNEIEKLKIPFYRIWFAKIKDWRKKHD